MLQERLSMLSNSGYSPDTILIASSLLELADAIAGRLKGKPIEAIDKVSVEAPVEIASADIKAELERLKVNKAKKVEAEMERKQQEITENPPEAEEAPPAPEAKPAITLNQLRILFAEKSKLGLKPKLLKILEAFDAKILPDVAEARYQELYDLVQGLS